MGRIDTLLLPFPVSSTTISLQQIATMVSMNLGPIFHSSQVPETLYVALGKMFGMEQSNSCTRTYNKPY